MFGSPAPSLLSDAASLIAIRTPNPPGNESQAAEWLAKRLQARASDVAVQKVSDGRANLLATFDFGPGPTVVFCTHLDVVPPQDDAQWLAVAHDGRLYGRGACDAKGILAAMIAACERLAASRDGRLAGRLLLAAVADEESDATGVQTLLASGLAADVAIVGEPTNNLLVVASRGAVRLAVTFLGRGAHASAPAGGVNAVYPAARFALGIEARNAELAEGSSLGSCAATVVNGGSKLNVIPDACTVQVDRRLGPDESLAVALADIESLATDAVRDQSESYEVAPAGVWLEPIDVSVELPVIGEMLKALDQQKPGPTFMAGTDAPHFVRSGIPTAILGPGSLSVAHTAGESVEISALAAAVEAYERIARALLITPRVDAHPTSPLPSS